MSAYVFYHKAFILKYLLDYVVDNGYFLQVKLNSCYYRESTKKSYILGTITSISSDVNGTQPYEILPKT